MLIIETTNLGDLHVACIASTLQINCNAARNYILAHMITICDKSGRLPIKAIAHTVNKWLTTPIYSLSTFKRKFTEAFH